MKNEYDSVLQEIKGFNDQIHRNVEIEEERLTKIGRGKMDQESTKGQIMSMMFLEK